MQRESAEDNSELVLFNNFTKMRKCGLKLQTLPKSKTWFKNEAFSTVIHFYNKWKKLYIKANLENVKFQIKTNMLWPSQ